MSSTIYSYWLRKTPSKLFDGIKNIVENELGTIKSVKVYEIYFNPTEFEVLIEYVVECDVGKVSVKLIYSENPQNSENPNALLQVLESRAPE